MREECDISLAKMTTFRMGGICRKIVYPHTGDDLSTLPTEEGKYCVISNGSNLLVSDSRLFDCVICMKEYDQSIKHEGEGVFRVGASVPIGRLISTAREYGYGGIEQLISIPGLLGGLIVMNASIGKTGDCISDYLVSVEAFRNGNITELKKEDCKFGYRRSLFQSGEYLVLSAIFCLPRITRESSIKRARRRRERVKEILDLSAPNFGSVFRICDARILGIARLIGLKKGGCAFSRKKSNWMLNHGGTFVDAERLLEDIERIHTLLGKSCEREVVTWK